jgi:glycosyltransferase involved in cell wall biosynthesis
MKLVWYSAAPWNFTGYGNITREMLFRLRDAGHYVECCCKHNIGSWMEWEGLKIFEIIGQHDILNQYVKENDFDYVITLLDTWALKGNINRWVPYYPSDCHIMSPFIPQSMANSVAQVAMSLDGQEQLKAYKGFNYDPMYAPHGIETETFKPNPEGRKAYRDMMKWGDDNFVVGAVGSNYPNDRKGFIPLLQAFSLFHERHENARLYLHTRHIEHTKNVPLAHVANSLGLGKVVTFVNQTAYELEKIGREDLCAIYNAMDVHCLPTHGEGFGIPIIEAQACGTPSITTATTSGPELTKGGWLIDINPDYDLEWLPMSTWWARPSIRGIDAAMEVAYRSWENGSITQVGESAHRGAQEYSWDRVWKDYWIPILDKLDAMKDEVKARENAPKKTPELAEVTA